MATALDYLPENALVLIEDTPRLRDAARDFLPHRGRRDRAARARRDAPGLDGYALDFAELAACRAPSCGWTFLNNVPELAPQHLENFIANQMNAYGGNLDMAAADIRSYTQQGRAVAVCAAASCAAAICATR